jgi:hypothetical protein
MKQGQEQEHERRSYFKCDLNDIMLCVNRIYVARDEKWKIRRIKILTLCREATAKK